MHRRCWLRIGFAAALAAAAGPRQAAAAAPNLVLRLQDDLGLRALPLLLAERLGHFAQERLEPRWLPQADDFAENDSILTVYALSFDRLVRRVLGGADLRLLPPRAWSAV